MFLCKQTLYFLLFITCSLVICNATNAQFYIRGQVKDVKGNAMIDVQITLISSPKYLYKSGSDGSFGIPTTKLVDTLVFEQEGFEKKKLTVHAKQFIDAVLIMLPETISSLRTKLNSQIKNLDNINQHSLFGFGESYTQTVENDGIKTNNFNEANYTLNIDRASYSNVRRFIVNSYKPPVEAVRIEELLNYFNFDEGFEKKEKFIINTNITSCPWNNKSHLLFVKTQAPSVDVQKISATNFVFLIDVSGSMDKPNRLPLVKSAFKLLIKNLRPIDSVAIVTYGGGVHVVLPSTKCLNLQKFNNIIDSLDAVGDTPGEGALRTAYEIARKSYIKTGTNRVILATDGDFNVGQTSEKQLEELVELQKSFGIYLTCLGVGMGNYKDSKLEALAKKGNGNFAYLDNVNEAEKVLVQEFTKTMFTVAKDAFIHIEFDKNAIEEFRLIGYDNKKDALQDSTNNLEGGEIGSGHSNITIFEIKLTQKQKIDTIIAKGKLQYKANEKDITNNFFVRNTTNYDINNASHTYKLATCVAWFGSLLKTSKHTKNSNFEQLIQFTEQSINRNNYIEMEFLQLVKKAALIYEPNLPKKRKKKYLQEVTQ